jgi:hypothetical protein
MLCPVNLCPGQLAFAPAGLLRPRPIKLRPSPVAVGFGINPDYSRCVGVDLEKACFIGILLQVCGFDS